MPSVMSVIMSGYHQAAPPSDPHPQSTGNRTMGVVYTRKSLGEVETLVKSAIWNTSNMPEELLAIEVSGYRLGKDGYIVTLTYENSGVEEAEEIKKRRLIKRQMDMEEYKLASKGTLYQNQENIMHVEVLFIPTVIKIHRCKSLSYLSKAIQEALVQGRLANAYSCKMLDLFIRRDSEGMYEMGLVMEALDRDLRMDIKYRKSQDNHYTETELRQVLECVAEALRLAKQRVRST